ncbi:MAG: DUF2807 domain-containing protein [Tannerellaceae bacterium]|jgi:hypothetical protein|nr:DUF2807 domain-containing protein [Tannerellaceae bacterium]
MKTKAFLFLIGMLALAAGVQGSDRTVKGNGEVITRTINITDYDEISVAGSMNFEYEQSDAAPFLSITVDENIFEYVRAEVKNGKLSVGPKTERDGWNGNSYNLQPTVFKVKSNSRNFKALQKAGSGNFIVLSPLHIGALQIKTAGSGNVELKQTVTGDELKVSLAGSGNVEANGAIAVKEVNISVAGSGKAILGKAVSGRELKLSLAGSGEVDAGGIDVESLNCSMSSSGKIKVEGSAKDASYSLAGSGSIKAFDCKAARVKASLTGSGRIETYAVEALSASAMGSGNISYKGNPASLNESTTGSSSVRQAR